MEIRSFTYRFLRRNINGAQLFKYQRYKRNVSQLLYRTLNENEIDSLITQLSLKSLRSCRPCRLRLLWWQRPWPQRWTNRFLVVVGNRDCGCSSRDTCHGNLLFVNRYSGEFLIAGLDGERLCTVPQRSCLPQPLPWYAESKRIRSLVVIWVTGGEHERAEAKSCYHNWTDKTFH